MKPSKTLKTVTAKKKPAKRKPAKRADTDRFRGDTFWGGVMMKLKKLGTAIEMKKGTSMDIDDPHYRWVNDRIEYYEGQDRLLTPDEMKTANELWAIYK